MLEKYRSIRPRQTFAGGREYRVSFWDWDREFVAGRGEGVGALEAFNRPMSRRLYSSLLAGVLIMPGRCPSIARKICLIKDILDDEPSVPVSKSGCRGC